MSLIATSNPNKQTSVVLLLRDDECLVLTAVSGVIDMLVLAVLYTLGKKLEAQTLLLAFFQHSMFTFVGTDRRYRKSQL